jgi:penicillin-binding protein 2
LVDLPGSIQHSCNIYFYNLGKKLGIEEIARYAEILGLGAKTGIDLPGEKEGLVPSPEWKRTTRNEPWYPGETISVSIGQGPLLVTPLQIAVHTSIIANRGERVTPHMLQSYTDPATREEKKSSLSNNLDRIEIKPSSFEKVIKGMWKAVNEGGTARLARVERFDVCGKTGSTQVISSFKANELSRAEKEIKTHSWFTGFAPRDNPKIVVTVLVAYGGAGGEQAAPMARKFFELYREKND